MDDIKLVPDGLLGLGSDNGTLLSGSTPISLADGEEDASGEDGDGDDGVTTDVRFFFGTSGG